MTKNNHLLKVLALAAVASPASAIAAQTKHSKSPKTTPDVVRLDGNEARVDIKFVDHGEITADNPVIDTLAIYINGKQIKRHSVLQAKDPTRPLVLIPGDISPDFHLPSVPTGYEFNVGGDLLDPKSFKPGSDIAKELARSNFSERPYLHNGLLDTSKTDSSIMPFLLRDTSHSIIIKPPAAFSHQDAKQRHALRALTEICAIEESEAEYQDGRPDHKVTIQLDPAQLKGMTADEAHNFLSQYKVTSFYPPHFKDDSPAAQATSNTVIDFGPQLPPLLLSTIFDPSDSREALEAVLDKVEHKNPKPTLDRVGDWIKRYGSKAGIALPQTYHEYASQIVQLEGNTAKIDITSIDPDGTFHTTVNGREITGLFALVAKDPTSALTIIPGTLPESISHVGALDQHGSIDLHALSIPFQIDNTSGVNIDSSRTKDPRILRFFAEAAMLNDPDTTKRQRNVQIKFDARQFRGWTAKTVKSYLSSFIISSGKHSPDGHNIVESLTLDFNDSGKSSENGFINFGPMTMLANGKTEERDGSDKYASHDIDGWIQEFAAKLGIVMPKTHTEHSVTNGRKTGRGE